MRHDGDVAPGEQGEDDDDGSGIGLTRGVANRIASVRPSQLRISPSEGQVAIARSVGLIRSIDIVMFLLLLVASNYLTQSQASLQPKCGGLGRASRPGGARQPAWRRNRDTIGVPHGTPAGEVPPQRSSHPPPPLSASCVGRGQRTMHPERVPANAFGVWHRPGGCCHREWLSTGPALRDTTQRPFLEHFRG